VRGGKVEPEHIKSAKSLECIIRAGSGYDNIDLNTANSMGIAVANCPGKNAVAVAELTMGLILAVDRRIPENYKELLEGKWNKELYSKASGIKGKTIGIIGFGNIGKETAKRALAFEMNVLGYTQKSTITMPGVK